MQLFMLPSCLEICAQMKMVERAHTLEFSEVRGSLFYHYQNCYISFAFKVWSLALRKYCY